MALPDSIKIYGDNTIVYGTGDLTKSPNIGYCQSATANTSADEVTVEDEYGETVSQIIGNRKWDLQIVFVIKGTFTDPKEGDKVALDDFDGAIVGVDRNWQNKAASQYTIRAKGFGKITYTPVGG